MLLKDLANSRFLSTADYFQTIRNDVKSRVQAIKYYIDELSEQLFATIDQLQVETLSKLEKLNNKLSEKIDIYQELSTVLLKDVNNETLNYDSIFQNFEINDKHKQELLKYENKFDSILKQYTFKANDWLPNVHSFGQIVNNSFKISNKSSENLKIEFEKNIKIDSMCLLDDEIYTVENKKTRLLKVYDKNFVFIRESKILEDSMYRLSPNLSLTSDNIEAIFVCDSADSTVYELNKQLNLIWRCIGKMGSQDGSFKSPNDICFFSNNLFVLDSGNCRIQMFSIDGDLIGGYHLLKSSRNELLESTKNLAISEGLVAVNSPKNGIYMFASNMDLKLVIEQKDVTTMCFVHNYLFAHTQQCLLICYQIFTSQSSKFYYQIVFSNTLPNFKHRSASMLLIDKTSICISFPKDNQVAIIHF